MAIPSRDFLSEPLVDSDMEYDFQENSYVPLVDGVQKNAYVDLVKDWGSKNNAQSYLDLVRRVVTEVILSQKDQRFREQMLYYMSHSRSARIELLKIYHDTVWYNRRDGGFMMAYNSGANLNQGKLIEFGIDKAISSIAKQIIKNSPLGSRYLPVDINEKQIFESLTTLLAYLVSESYITQIQSDVVAESKDLNDLPFTEDYQLIALENDRYLFTNTKSMEKYLLQKKIYNNSDGTW